MVESTNPSNNQEQEFQDIIDGESFLSKYKLYLSDSFLSQVTPSATKTSSSLKSLIVAIKMQKMITSTRSWELSKKSYSMKNLNVCKNSLAQKIACSLKRPKKTSWCTQASSSSIRILLSHI